MILGAAKDTATIASTLMLDLVMASVCGAREEWCALSHALILPFVVCYACSHLNKPLSNLPNLKEAHNGILTYRS